MSEGSAAPPLADGDPGAVASENAGRDGSRAQGEIADCTDLANAERLVKDHGRDMLYCSDLGGWHAWDGSRWARDETGKVQRRAHTTVEVQYAEARAALARSKEQHRIAKASNDLQAEEKAGAKVARHVRLFKWAKTSQNAGRLMAMVGEARVKRGIPHVPAEFDADPWVFNAANGTICLRTGELRPHHREALLTKVAGVACAPVEARSSLWAGFLRCIFDGDEELIGFVQRFLGYSLVGLPAEEKIAVFHGSGANGKSTLLSVVAHVLGDYYQQMDPDLLLVSRGVSNKVDSEKAALKGTRLAVCSETSQLRTINEGQVKQLASTDQIVGRRLNHDPIKFAPSHQLIMVTNHRPTIRSTDEGTWRRVVLVPFAVTIPPKERQINLAQQIQGEAPAIMRWLVNGCLEWQRRGLDPCAAVLGATREYRQDEDEVGRFLEQCTIKGANAHCKPGDIYRSYKIWCEVEGVAHTPTATMFGKLLTARGLEREENGDKRYRGLGLLAERGLDDDDQKGQGELCH